MLAVVTAALLVLTVVGAASGDTLREVSQGSLTWGVKQSFRDYVTGPIGQGRVELGHGATRAEGDGGFVFHEADGTVSEGGALDLSFAGSVRFTGHDGSLDVTLSKPRLDLDEDGTGTLTVAHRTAGDSSATRVPIAEITDADVRSGGDTVRVSGVKTRLSAEGEQVFAFRGSPFYPESTELDPISLDIGLRPAPQPDPTGPEPTTPSPSDPGTSSPTPTSSTPTSSRPSTPKPTNPTPSAPRTSSPSRAGSGAKAAAGALTWGVKSSFRSYVGGPVADGTVTTSRHAGTASDGSYTFPQRGTSATPPSPKGTTTYRGTVRFRGHHGQLDMSLRNPRVVVTSASTGRLVVDARPTGASSFTTIKVSTLDLTKGTKRAGSGSVTYWGVPVTLSGSGTKLFSWDGRAMYPAGTTMDPVSFTVGTDARVSGGGGPSTSSPKASGRSNAAAPAGQGDPATGPAGAAQGSASAGRAGGTAGSLRWGVRRSFRDYITGPIAGGSISVGGGASARGGTFVFPQDGGPDGDGGASYSGVVSFTGHHGLLDLRLSDLAVSMDSPRTATLTATVNGLRLDVATLKLAAGAKSRSEGLTTYRDVPATLTSSGEQLFEYNGSSFYPAGTTMDPVTFSVGSGSGTAAGTDTAAAQTVASAAGSGAAGPAGEPGAAEGAAAEALSKGACKATGRDLEWGFKQSFRSYVSGSIANGEWTTRGGARYSTPTFIWPEGTGSIDGKKPAGAISFPGAVTFTGHDGAMRTSVSDPEVRLQGDRAVIAMDVTGADMEAAMEGEADTTTRRDVPFVEVDLSDAEVATDDGRTTITATKAPTSLTAKGEAAFSNYEAGTAFDPVSFTITAKSDCLAPADLADDPESAAALEAPSDDGASAADTDDGLPLWAAVAGGAGLGALAAAAVVILIQRHRKGIHA